ncbi:YslB family protein [Camelliibacillus cellulosilyticus]|uniref:YslB family protein n=1 Tax=Camelliibacillus cellulosilyticus TaxID=2174486 RepID=A0ABV9GNE8_9BACL
MRTIDRVTMETYGGREVPAFGYELLRSVLIQDILGDETGQILYWGGRRLARQYPCGTIDGVIDFFEKAAWGTLTAVDESRGKALFELTSDLGIARIKSGNEDAFSLETGFLAEQLQHIKGFITEGYSEVKNGRHKKVLIQIRWDVKDPVESGAL